MRQFHHIGLLATEPMPGESYMEGLKVWVTDPANDPNLIEWVRLTPGNAFEGTAVAKGPHTSYTVPDLDAGLEGKDVVFGPYAVNESLRIAYFREDGHVIEYMEVK